jgi:hypothetical protein
LTKQNFVRYFCAAGSETRPHNERNNGMTCPHNQTSDFAVCIEPSGSGWRVYLQRMTPKGVGFAKHKIEPFSDLSAAEMHADALAEEHGGLAVLRN